MYEKKGGKKPRKWEIRPINKNRKMYGEFNYLFSELERNHGNFFQYVTKNVCALESSSLTATQDFGGQCHVTKDFKVFKVSKQRLLISETDRQFNDTLTGLNFQQFETNP